MFLLSYVTVNIKTVIL